MVEVFFFALDRIDAYGCTISIIIVIIIPRHTSVIPINIRIPSKHVNFISKILLFVRLIEIDVLCQVRHDFRQLFILLLGSKPGVIKHKISV